MQRMLEPINLARLDLVSLRLAVRCVELGSISAAAAQCHFSVMGASERLRRLEHALGTSLFHRHRRGVTATEAGIALARSGQAILDSVEQLARAVRGIPVSPPTERPNLGRGHAKASGCPLAKVPVDASRLEDL